MKYNLGTFIFFLAYTIVKGDFQAYITGGAQAKYSAFPHSIFLHLNCDLRYRCGGSVVNQILVLTAAHCFMHCHRLKNETIHIRYGHEEVKQMKGTQMKDFVIHPNFVPQTMLNDISLILTQERIPLNNGVKRVILMKSPPEHQHGYVAGWGYDENKVAQPILKYTEQLIQKKRVCQAYRLDMSGTFCAGPIEGLGTADQGDSGSALVVKKYIQIGLVSYKKPDRSSLVAYTNISLFLDWMKQAARTIVCKHNNKNIG